MSLSDSDSTLLSFDSVALLGVVPPPVEAASRRPLTSSSSSSSSWLLNATGDSITWGESTKIELVRERASSTSVTPV